MGVLEIDQRLSTVMESMPTNLSIEKSAASDVHKQSESVAEIHAEFTETLEIDNNCRENRNATVPVSETKIQLSFSVDRLLNVAETQANDSCENQKPSKICEKFKNSISSEVKCFENANMSLYGGGSCTHPNCGGLVGNAHNEMQIENATINFKKYSISALGNGLPGKFYQQVANSTPPYLDFKSIVRPTPIRAAGNGRETGALHAPCSTFATSTLLRFQQQQKFSATHSQMLNMPPGLLQNLGGLKSFTNTTLSTQSFAPTALLSRFPGLKPHTHQLMDIPMSTSSLINHHHRQHHQPQQHPHHVAQSTSISANHAVGSNAATQMQLTAVGGAAIHMNNNNNNNSTSSVSSCAGGVGGGGGGKRKRSWSRAVFSNLQRKGLEIQFQQQKYITKPDRRKLAARLNLTDAQVKVWFQNRRMKWRHTRENLKSGQEKQLTSAANSGATTTTTSSIGKQECNAQAATDEKLTMDGFSSEESSCGDYSENDDEIDVVQ